MTTADTTSSGLPAPRPRLVICPFCGLKTEEASACSHCKARFDPLSRQATQNAMGPWYVHDPARPHAPGCRYQALKSLVESGRVTRESVVRGPSTRQFWTLARHTPGVANLLGVCHNCGAEAEPDDYACDACGAVFAVDQDRQHLGLGPVRDLNPVAHPPEEPDTPEFRPVARASNGAARAGVAHRATPRTAPVAPKIRRISTARLAVNWLVGTALFVLVLAIALSTLRVIPDDFFGATPDEPERLASVDPDPTSIGPATPIESDTPPERELRSFLQDAEGLEDQSASRVDPEREQPAAVVQGPDDGSDSEARSLSRTEQVRQQAVDALRLGDPASIRDAITLLESLMAQGRSPDWASGLRERLLTRLERARFARLP